MPLPFGFAIRPGSENYTTPGSYTFSVPVNFRAISTDVNHGQPGSPFVGPPDPYNPYGPPPSTPGNPGTPSSFGGDNSDQTYQRHTSALRPRQSVTVVVGAGGSGQPPGANGSVNITIS